MLVKIISILAFLLAVKEVRSDFVQKFAGWKNCLQILVEFDTNKYSEDLPFSVARIKCRKLKTHNDKHGLEK